MNRTHAELGYKGLLVFTVLATLGGFLTLLPWEDASQTNLLGYLSLCTFTPAATLWCFFLAAFSCTIRAAYFSPTALAEGSTSRGLNKKRITRLVILGLIAMVPSLLWVQKGMTYDAGLVEKNEARKAEAAALALTGAETPSMKPGLVLEDGTYTGSAYYLDVSAELRARIEGGVLVAIDLVKSSNISRQLARSLAKEAIAYNSPWVDAITGATLSSDVWKAALADALDKAVR